MCEALKVLVVLGYEPQLSLKNGLSALFSEKVKLQIATEAYRETHSVEAKNSTFFGRR